MSKAGLLRRKATGGMFADDGKSAQDAAAAIWGGDELTDEERAALKAGRREKLAEIPVKQIAPDVRQPRRVAPSGVRMAQDVIGAWVAASGFAAESLRELVEGATEIDDEFEPDAVQAGLLKLAALAASIRREGLTNPITVVKQGTGYALETGERRWMAYRLIGWLGIAGYDKIPARVVDTFDVWRQATENNTRADLNAIGRARQFAILLMDLLGAERFAGIEAFEHEQDYYAQVADGDLLRVPRGKGQALVEAMGLSNAGQLRHYRALLRLPRELWQAADDANWPERAIREAMTGGDPDVDRVSADAIDTVTTVTVLDGADERQAGGKVKSPPVQFALPFDDEFEPKRRIGAVIAAAKAGNREKARRQALEVIEAMNRVLRWADGG